MKYFQSFVLVIVTILPILGCQKSNRTSTQTYNEIYIKDFELLQENPNNQISLKITSPKAIIDQLSNDIEIYESTIEILNENSRNFKVKAGNATLNSLSNSIRVFNNVKISFLYNQEYYITTNSFDWDFNTSVININNPLEINLDSSNITATNGFYNIDSNLLKLDNIKFNTNIYNSSGKDEYRVEIKSDFAKWFKKDNTLVFTSNEKQVETTINFLFTE